MQNKPVNKLKNLINLLYIHFYIFRRMFKRLLDPKIDKRPISVLEVNKYLEDRWLAKLGAEKALNGELTLHRDIAGDIYRDVLCDVPSIFPQAAPTRETSSVRLCTVSIVPWRRRISSSIRSRRTASRRRWTIQRKRIASGNGYRPARSSRRPRETSRICTRTRNSMKMKTETRVKRQSRSP